MQFWVQNISTSHTTKVKFRNRSFFFKKINSVLNKKGYEKKYVLKERFIKNTNSVKFHNCQKSPHQSLIILELLHVSYHLLESQRILHYAVIRNNIV